MDTSLTPGANSSSFVAGGAVLDWLKQAVEEGDALNQADPLYDQMDQAMDYISGRHYPATGERARPKYLSQVVINESRRATIRNSSALTDLKPVFAFKTQNPNFQQHALQMNNLTVAWWINTMADLAVGNAVKYASVAGAGDLVLEWDPGYGLLGDQVLTARDVRDTLPVRPSRDGSIQNWYAAIFREAHSPNVLKAIYPQWSAELAQGDNVWGAGVYSKFRLALSRLRGGPTTTLSGLKQAKSGSSTGNEIIVYKCFMNDPSINLTGKPVLMGKPGASWSYIVPPGARLYPRKRLIISTERRILYDDASIYLHGMIPAARLVLESWPWSFFGTSLVTDQKGLQDSINDTFNDMRDAIRKCAHPAIAADAQSVPRSILQNLDTRKPGWKMQHRASFAQNGGVQMMQDPPLPAWTYDFFQGMRQMYGELSGTSTLDALQAAAGQEVPAADTIEAFMSALSPELKMKGRMLELTLRELAEQVKVNFMQFYDARRRVTISGDAGLTLEDFDFDPGNMVPAMDPAAPNYLPELDAAKDRAQRIEFFRRFFTFYVTPNSLLALNTRTEQMKYVQLARAGYCDFWTLLEKLEVPNVGDPPPMPLPPTETQLPEILNALQAGQVPPGVMVDVQAIAAGVDPAQAIKILRKPMTITERLMAQQALGIGMAVNPAGRKASGQAPPQQETKNTPDGGQRTTVTESHK